MLAITKQGITAQKFVKSNISATDCFVGIFRDDRKDSRKSRKPYKYWDVAPPGYEHMTPVQYKALQGNTDDILLQIHIREMFISIVNCVAFAVNYLQKEKNINCEKLLINGVSHAVKK